MYLSALVFGVAQPNILHELEGGGITIHWNFGNYPPNNMVSYPIATEASGLVELFSLSSRQHQLWASLVFRSMEITMHFFSFEFKSTSERSYSIFLKHRDSCADFTSITASLTKSDL
jgi:hypothetical protein